MARDGITKCDENSGIFAEFPAIPNGTAIALFSCTSQFVGTSVSIDKKEVIPLQLASARSLVLF